MYTLWIAHPKPARPMVLVFPRHVGCPFAERDIHALVHLVLAAPSRFVLTPATDDAPALKLQFLIAPHSDASNSREWFAAVLHAAFASFKPAAAADAAASDDDGTAPAPAPDASLIQEHFALFPDGSDRVLAKAFGVGSLASVGTLFSGAMFGALSALKQQGIVNRKTGGGSDRWATHGACAVDADGIVKWSWVAQAAQEEGDWEACVKALGL